MPLVISFRLTRNNWHGVQLTVVFKNEVYNHYLLICLQIFAIFCKLLLMYLTVWQLRSTECSLVLEFPLHDSTNICKNSLCITLLYSLFAEVGLERSTYMLLQAVGQKVCTIAESIFLQRTLIHLDSKHPSSHSSYIWTVSS